MKLHVVSSGSSVGACAGQRRRGASCESVIAEPTGAGFYTEPRSQRLCYFLTTDGPRKRLRLTRQAPDEDGLRFLDLRLSVSICFALRLSVAALERG